MAGRQAGPASQVAAVVVGSLPNGSALRRRLAEQGSCWTSGGHEHTVGKWRQQFVEDGIEGLTDEYRAGRLRTVSDA